MSIAGHVMADQNAKYNAAPIVTVPAITTQEIIDTQERLFAATAYWSPRSEGWLATRGERLEFMAKLTPDQKEVFNAENVKQAAAEYDRIKREMATREREHTQAFTKKAAVFVASMGVAAPAVLPLLFGPATGGLLAGASAGVAGAGAGVAIADIPAGSTAAESGLAAGTITGAAGEGASTSILASLGSVAGAVAKPVAEVVVALAKPAVEIIGGAVEVVGSLAKPVAEFTSDVSSILSKAGQITNAVENISGNKPPTQLGSTLPPPAAVPSPLIIMPDGTQDEMVNIPNVVLYCVAGGLALLIGKRLLK